MDTGQGHSRVAAAPAVDRGRLGRDRWSTFSGDPTLRKGARPLGSDFGAVKATLRPLVDARLADDPLVR